MIVIGSPDTGTVRSWKASVKRPTFRFRSTW